MGLRNDKNEQNEAWRKMMDRLMGRDIIDKVHGNEKKMYQVFYIIILNKLFNHKNLSH